MKSKIREKIERSVAPKCPECGSTDTIESPNQNYMCRGCRTLFHHEQYLGE